MNAPALSITQLSMLVFAPIMILLPLVKLGIEGERSPGAWRYFLYFAALGLGFMLVEVALMQKLVIFLGHPTYALSVVLIFIGAKIFYNQIYGKMDAWISLSVTFGLLAIGVIYSLYKTRGEQAPAELGETGR